MAKFTAEVFVDWDADGNYADSNEDLTSYVTSLTFSHRQNLDTEQVSSGVVTLTLDNFDHRFSAPKGTISGLQPGRTLWARIWYPFDTFVGTDGTNLSAHSPTQDANWTWVAALNNFQLNGSGAARTSTTSAAHINYFEFSDTDVEIAAQYRRGTDANDHGGFVFRYVDADNYGYLRATASAIEVRKVISGSDSQIATKAYTWANGATKLLQLRLHGGIAVVLVDGVQIEFGSGTHHLGEQSVADGGIDAGTKHGLYCDGAADHTWLQFGGFKSLLHGFVESIIPRPALGAQYAYIKAHDDISEQQKTEIHYFNAGQADSRLDQSLNIILTSIGWRSRYHLDSCEIGVHDDDTGLKSVDMTAQDAILQVQIEEDGLFYIDGDGYTRLENRGHRGGAPHTASKATYRDTANGSDPSFANLIWEDGDSGIENRNIFVVRRTNLVSSGAILNVWVAAIDATDNPWPFDADETKDIEWEINSDYDCILTRVAPDDASPHLDFVANTLADATGSNITSELTVVGVLGKAGGKFGVTRVTFGSTPGFLTQLKQRAKALVFENWTAVINEDSTSVSTYRERFKKFDCLFHDRFDSAEAAGVSRLGRRKDPKTRLTLTLVGGDVPTARHMMQRRISDLVRCIYSDMGLDDTYYIEGESWTISQAGFATTQTLQLREA